MMIVIIKHWRTNRNVSIKDGYLTAMMIKKLKVIVTSMASRVCEECDLEGWKCGGVTYHPELKKHLCEGCFEQYESGKVAE